MFRLILLTLFCCHLFLVHGLSQDFLVYESNFTILEKNEIKGVTSITKGKMNINNTHREMLIDLTFPNTERWVIKDSFFTKIVNDSIVSKTTIPGLDKMTIYTEFLNMHKSDYGLKQMGFKIEKVEMADGKSIVSWLPPTQLKLLIGNAITEIENNLLSSVHIFNVENEEIMASFMSGYSIHNNVPMPSKVISKIKTKGGSIFKSMEFKDVKVN